MNISLHFQTQIDSRQRILPINDVADPSAKISWDPPTKNRSSSLLDLDCEKHQESIKTVTFTIKSPQLFCLLL